MSRLPDKQRRTGILMSIVSAVLLMCILRVDWWWWGTKQPLIFGWFTWPMIYHLIIWAVGWLLVILTTIFLWEEPEL